MENLRKEILGLMEAIEESWYDVSVLLYQIYKDNNHLQWGYENFKDYVEGELSLSYRNAMYRRQIGETIVKYTLNKDLVIKVGGWLKFKELTCLFTEGIVTTDKEFEELVDKVEDLTHEQTKELVKAERQGKGIEPADIKWYKFRATEDQVPVFDMAIKEAMEVLGTNNPTLGWELICTEFLINKSNGISKEIVKELVMKDEKEPRFKRKEPAHKGKKRKTTKRIKREKEATT